MSSDNERMLEHDLPINLFVIYQVKAGEDYHLLRFSSLKMLGSEPVNRSNYDRVYSGYLDAYAGESVTEVLDRLYERFNLDHPADFTGHSLSVSDVIALNRDGDISCYYVEPIGFQEIKGFLEDRNYLKSAEMSQEDDYDMIDGIINNGEKKSIRAELEEHRKELAAYRPHTPKHVKEQFAMERE